jgi:hypothetical protein
MAGSISTISAITTAKAASVTTAVAAATATIVVAVAVARRGSGAGLSLVEAVGGDFAAFGELFVEDVLFGIGFVEIFVVFGVGFIEVLEIIESGVVDAVLFFEVVHFLLFVDVAGARDLVDGHLADHGAEVSCALEGLFLFEVFHLFDGAGVKGGVVVLLVKGLLFERPGAGGDGGCLGGSVGGDVTGGVEGGDFVGSKS